MKKKKIPPFGDAARTLLYAEIAIILGALAAFLFFYLRAYAVDPLRADLEYPEMTEYIISSLTVALGGALLVNRVEIEKET